MTSKERVHAMLGYKGFDRPPVTYFGTPEITRDLKVYLGAGSDEELRTILGDDLRGCHQRYIGPKRRTFDDGSWEGMWGERYKLVDYGNGKYPESAYLPYKDVTDVRELMKFKFPDPDWFDYSHIKEDCEKISDYAVFTGHPGIPDFINGTARMRGVEQVLLDIGMRDPVYMALMDIQFELHYEVYKRILEAAKGAIDIFWMGEDYGNQNGLMISPNIFDTIFAPKMKAFYDLAHSYGAKTMLHCCGSCRDIIPKLIDIGLDILDVVQVEAAGMDIEGLHRDFYGRIAFCGSMSVQTTLPFGSVQDVEREVDKRMRLFEKGGMIIAPTHAIQVGTPVENILAMYRRIGSISEIKEAV